jgi:hypothetical protein
MKFKSTLLAQASGALAGAVASHNRGGMYLRARSIPTNPGTDAQNDQRAALGALVGIFQSLTDIERQSWEDYADNVPITDRLGEPRKATALNMFIKCQSFRMNLFGISEVSRTAPTTYNTGAIPVISSLTATYFSPGLLKIVSIINVPDAPAVAVTGDRMLLFHSAPQNQSIHSFKGPFTFMSWTEIGNLSAQPVTYTPYASGNWKVLGGDKVFVRAVVTRKDGRYSGAAIGSDITGPLP